MMQQVAAPTSFIAANGRPDSIVGDELANDGRSSQFNEGKSAFEEAIALADKSAYWEKERSLIHYEPQPKEQGDLKMPRSDKSDISQEKFYSQPAEPSRSSDVRDTDGKREQSEALIQQAALDDKARAESITQADEAEYTSNHERLNDASLAQSITVEELSGEFDYVNFVTQIQSLNTEPVDVSAELTDGLENDEQALDLTSVSLSKEELQIILDAQKAGVNLDETLSQEQLDKLDAAINSMLMQYHQKTEQKFQDLSTEDQKSITTSLENESESSTELDKALMQVIIQQPLDSSKISDTEISPTIDHSKTLKAEIGQDITEQTINSQNAEDAKLAQAINSQAMNSEADAELELADAKILATINNSDTEEGLIEQGLAKNAEALRNQQQLNADTDMAATPNGAVKNNVNAEEVPNLEAIEAASAMFNEAARINEDNAQSIDVTLKEALLAQNAERSAIISPAVTGETQVQVKTTNEDTQALVKQLALLDERSQTNTIENIKSRVEKFAADLSANAKGNEFIAAMQSGLKEFKEQMQAGREPGIDLKALVSDALAQSNVEIPAQNQPKVDNALTQFSAIMNLANSVNQSTQAQAHQLFGLNETQMIKESNVLHAEGTKLAQQSASNFDKAVNIFKPEGQQQLAEKVRWMVSGRNPTAEIRLDPPDLGAMQIKVNLGSDTASVNFTVQSSQAKEALDQQLPKLREMLQEQGIELGQSSVQQEGRGQAQQQEQQMSGQSNSSNTGGDLASQSQEAMPQGVIEQRVVGGSLGGIDYYA